MDSLSIEFIKAILKHLKNRFLDFSAKCFVVLSLLPVASFKSKMHHLIFDFCNNYTVDLLDNRKIYENVYHFTVKKLTMIVYLSNGLYLLSS